MPAEAPAVAVPPRAAPRLPTPADVALTTTITKQVSQATRQLDVAAAADHVQTSRAVELGQRLAISEVRLNELQQGQRLAILLVKEKEGAVKRRAVSAYTSGGVNRLNDILNVHDLNDLGRRMSFIGAVANRDRRAVKEYVDTRQAANADLGGEVSKLKALQDRVAVAQAQADQAQLAHQQSQVTVDELQAGHAIAVNGFVFPVGTPHDFTDTFGAPRLPGTPYAHKHQGNDIAAAMGTPLYACERGVVFHISVDFLGGNGLWVAGLSGTKYYYAHLSAYAAGLRDGMVVEGGDLIGYVGNSGAGSFGPHLHFEVHPGGGAAIDPYPLLKAADDAANAAGATASTPPAGAAPAAPPSLPADGTPGQAIPAAPPTTAAP